MAYKSTTVRNSSTQPPCVYEATSLTRARSSEGLKFTRTTRRRSQSETRNHPCWRYHTYTLNIFNILTIAGSAPRRRCLQDSSSMPRPRDHAGSNALPWVCCIAILLEFMFQNRRYSATRAERQSLDFLHTVTRTANACIRTASGLRCSRPHPNVFCRMRTQALTLMISGLHSQRSAAQRARHDPCLD